MRKLSFLKPLTAVILIVTSVADLGTSAEPTPLPIVGPPAATNSAMVLEVQLIWATNDETSPDPVHKPAEMDVVKKLTKAPYKWKNYFEENRREVVLPLGPSQTVEMSKKCSLVIKNAGNNRLEVELIGSGKPVVKNIQNLPFGEVLVLGGDSRNDTAWLVVIKRKDDGKRLLPK